MKNIIKNLVINKPAIFFSDTHYANYILLLSLISFPVLRSRLKNVKRVQSLHFPNFYLYTVEINKRIIMFQSLKRISRFMKGFQSAGARIWNRYKIDQLIVNDSPFAIIDIGANIGEFSYFSRKKFTEHTLVYAVEPDPLAYQCLMANLHGSNVKFSMTPFSEFKGEKIFYLKTANADSSFEIPRGESIKYPVLAQTLDQFFQKQIMKYPILMKMDVEGHEPEVLRGGLDLLRLVKWISIDAGNERDKGLSNTITEVVKILRENGFTKIEVHQDSIVTGIKQEINKKSN